MQLYIFSCLLAFVGAFRLLLNVFMLIVLLTTEYSVLTPLDPKGIS